MLLRYSGNDETSASRIERAVRQVLSDGLRTADIAGPGDATVGSAQMGAAVVAALAGQHR